MFSNGLRVTADQGRFGIVALGAVLPSQNDDGGISSRFRDTIDYARKFKDQERGQSGP